MSPLFVEFRVVMMMVRHSNVGREDINSSISRQHVANPSPLRCTARQHVQLGFLLVANPTCLLR